MASFMLFDTDWAHDSTRLSAVRRAVFIEEQGVPESMEWDEFDRVSLHVLATSVEGQPIGCARLLPDGHIGRMAVLPAWRGYGVGKALLSNVLSAAKARGHTTLKLSAQTHAAGFYQTEGFEIQGPEYEEAGIPHVAMQKRLT